MSIKNKDGGLIGAGIIWIFCALIIVGMFLLPGICNAAVPGWGFLIGVILDFFTLLPFLIFFIFLSLMIWAE